MGLGKKVFIRKSGANGADLYKWSPDTSDKRARKSSATGAVSNYFCTTPLGSQGNDYKVTYTYVVVLLNGESIRTAYVQCDYVQ